MCFSVCVVCVCARVYFSFSPPHPTPHTPPFPTIHLNKYNMYICNFLLLSRLHWNFNESQLYRVIHYCIYAVCEFHVYFSLFSLLWICNTTGWLRWGVGWWMRGMRMGMAVWWFMQVCKFQFMFTYPFFSLLWTCNRSKRDGWGEGLEYGDDGWWRYLWWMLKSVWGWRW